MNSVIDFINKKRELVEKDYKIYFLFENLIVKENEQLYHDKSGRLEEIRTTPLTAERMRNFLNMAFMKTWKDEKIRGVKTIHVANLSGFNSGEIAFNDYTFTNASLEDQTSIFLSAFEKLVSDPDMIQQRSVIILSTKKHHMSKIKKLGSVYRTAEKKRKLAAESPGQQTISKYFKLTKNCVKNEPIEQYKVEEIITRTRGKSCNIEILWLPDVELNPCSYVSVTFNSMVMNYFNDNENSSLKDACSAIIDSMPCSVWNTYHNFILNLEDELLEEMQKKRRKLIF